MSDYAHLKSRAGAATGWIDKRVQYWMTEAGNECLVGQVDEDGAQYPVITIDTAQYDCEEGAQKLGAFIAAANPAAIGRLVADFERHSTDLGVASSRVDELEIERAALASEKSTLRALLAKTLDYFTESGLPEDLLQEYKVARIEAGSGVPKP